MSRVYTMLKADPSGPSILQCTVRQLACNVWRNCVCRIGLIGVSGHLILEHNRGPGDEDTRN